MKKGHHFPNFLDGALVRWRVDMKPILFSTPMVRAILDGNKTMTRRVIKPQPETDKSGVLHWKGRKLTSKDAPYKPGDILYVRETWASALLNGGLEGFIDTFAYKADGSVRYSSRKAEDLPPNAISAWRPSIHMPREAARIFLRVKEVRVERIQEITANPDEFEREGIDITAGMSATSAAFAEVWDKLCKPADLKQYGWEANPWVWVISFERTEANGG